MGDHDDRATTPDGQGVVLLRPNLMWVVLNACGCLASLACVLVTPVALALAAGFAYTMALATRSRATIEGGVIRRRGLIFDDAPMDLSQLRDVVLHRSFGPGLFDFNLELRLTDANRRVQIYSLRWWSPCDDLLRIVAYSISENNGDDPAPFRWTVPLDRSTAQRLSRYR